MRFCERQGCGSNPVQLRFSERDTQYLFISNYIAIYRVENNSVSIIRIMDGRTDYLRYLLSEI